MLNWCALQRFSYSLVVNRQRFAMELSVSNVSTCHHSFLNENILLAGIGLQRSIFLLPRLGAFSSLEELPLATSSAGASAGIAWITMKMQARAAQISKVFILVGFGKLNDDHRNQPRYLYHSY